jgi:hypothetical protein
MNVKQASPQEVPDGAARKISLSDADIGVTRTDDARSEEAERTAENYQNAQNFQNN